MLNISAECHQNRSV